MKSIKTFSFLLILAMIFTSCSSDDNDTIRVEDKNQVEIDPTLNFEGIYNFMHAGNPISFTFSKDAIQVNLANMTGSEQENQRYEIISIYKNKLSNIEKVVTKDIQTGNFKTFFMTNKTSESLLFNMDGTYSFENIEQAISSTYPQANEVIEVDHSKNIFGWIKLEKDNEIVIELPVQGKYQFSQQGFTYFYVIENDKVNFNDSYSMEVLAFNTKTNKILLKGIDPSVENSYYVMQLQNIEAESVEIARKTYKTEDAKELSQKDFASQSTLEANFTKYDKQD